ncbi:MAG: ATP-binding cassette domain-containing protein [Microgenomates group bacterium]|nr:ATP-binding cassette domain-containing protein [Microgenomates group bacterium]
MITVRNLTKVYQVPIKGKSFLSDIFNRQYQENVALNKISFEIAEDELVGFIGPNGAGKTTTLKILAGILYPTAGQVSVVGYTPFEKKAAFLRQISFIAGQRNQLIWDLPVIDSFYLNKEIYQISNPDFNKRIDELSSLLNCRHLLNKPVKMLSLGERMKMELIAALIHQPKIIFFDEPTIGLDIFSQETIRHFIKNYQKNYRATIVLTSHYLEDVKRMAKRLIIIDKGKIIYDGSLKRILQEYSKGKKVSLFLENEAKPELIYAIGRPVTYEYPKVVFFIKKEDLPEKIKLITKTLPFTDLTVEDESIERIIKNFFKNQ